MSRWLRSTRAVLGFLVLASVFGGEPQPASAHPPFRLALLRGVPVRWNLESNFKVFRAAVPLAASRGAGLLVTPECWLDGYASPDPESTRERLMTIAQPLGGSRYLEEVAALAREHHLWICFGFTLSERGLPFNAAGLWNSDGGLVGIYRKAHLLDHDLQYAPGDSLATWQSPWGRLGIIICADRRWPETVRVERLQGARLILNPSYGSHSDLNEAMMRTRAFENGCYIAFTHPEESLVTGPDGSIVAKEEATPASDSPSPAKPSSWHLAVVDLDLSRADDHGHLDHRRPDLYAPLVEPRR